MDTDNFYDEEEACDGEIKSVALTAASFVVVVIGVISWVLFA